MAAQVIGPRPPPGVRSDAFMAEDLFLARLAEAEAADTELMKTKARRGRRRTEVAGSVDRPCQSGECDDLRQQARFQRHLEIARQLYDMTEDKQLKMLDAHVIMAHEAVFWAR
eukprot:CAMPEP_0206166400 /NCGR_PEP_ID=MMETSP1474-20131121/23943_1 /ASSEMBLY_ACC=CAM_ASM_001110 /TAXON_ID=97495 /ORGANISM="Imantonia sp., Strain RCC918" /LENGTH=112 /DNA_ID=CAMNT_0053570381 /DNA_START=418 /DNA_END=752 /DNA_ORIENTATION=-